MKPSLASWTASVILAAQIRHLMSERPFSDIRYLESTSQLKRLPLIKGGLEILIMVTVWIKTDGIRIKKSPECQVSHRRG